MTFIQTEPPVAEPVTLAELKDHLRIDTNDEDAQLESLIRVARTHLESVSGVVLMTQSFRLLLDDWPSGDLIELLKTPIQTLVSIKVYDAKGVPHVMDWTTILLDTASRPARVLIKERMQPGKPINGIEIDFIAGFATADDVPDDLKRAILLHAAHLYEFRGAVSMDMQPASIPQGYDRLIAPWLRRSV